MRHAQSQPATATSADDDESAPAPSKGRRVLMPLNFARIKRNGDVHAKSIRGEHFADAPSTANPDYVTLQEEDKIMAYYGGGYLYALPERTEPVL